MDKQGKICGQTCGCKDSSECQFSTPVIEQKEETPVEIFIRLDNQRAVKWEGLSDGGKRARAIEAMEIYGKQLSESKQLTPNDGWIRTIDERPHERMKAVLVFNGNAPEYNQCVTQATWFAEGGGKFKLEVGVNLIGGVTHWMPLPKPPKQ